MGRKKTLYAHQVSVEEQDLKAHGQNEKVSHHVRDADLLGGGAHGKTATADVDASIDGRSESGEKDYQENAQD